MSENTAPPKRHERRKNIGKRRRNGEVITRLPGSRVPFKHAMALMDQMALVVHKGLSPIDRQIELDRLPPYTSRGHGSARGRAAKATRARSAPQGFGPSGQPHTYTMAEYRSKRAKRAQFQRERIARREQRQRDKS